MSQSGIFRTSRLHSGEHTTFLRPVPSTSGSKARAAAAPSENPARGPGIPGPTERLPRAPPQGHRPAKAAHGRAAPAPGPTPPAGSSARSRPRGAGGREGSAGPRRPQARPPLPEPGRSSPSPGPRRGRQPRPTPSPVGLPRSRCPAARPATGRGDPAAPRRPLTRWRGTESPRRPPPLPPRTWSRSPRRPAVS